VLSNLLNPLKTLYIIKIVGPLLFAPLLSPLELLPALPVVAFALFSHDPDHYCACGQYDAGLIPFVFWAGIMGFNRLQETFRMKFLIARLPLAIITSSLLFNFVLSPSPLSRLFWVNEKAFTYYYKAYLPSTRAGIIKEAINRFIPDNPEVAVSIQTTVNWSRLTHRNKMFVFPEATTSPYSLCNGNNILADYVVLDGKTPPFIFDIIDEEQYHRYVKEVQEKYHLMYEYDEFSILKKS
jgi:uncharacterized membrane protein